jgi:hypothetical protein
MTIISDLDVPVKQLWRKLSVQDLCPRSLQWLYIKKVLYQWLAKTSHVRSSTNEVSIPERTYLARTHPYTHLQTPTLTVCQLSGQGYAGKQTLCPLLHPKILAIDAQLSTDYNLKLIHHTIPKAACSRKQAWQQHSSKPGPHSWTVAISVDFFIALHGHC